MPNWRIWSSASQRTETDSTRYSAGSSWDRHSSWPGPTPIHSGDTLRHHHADWLILLHFQQRKAFLSSHGRYLVQSPCRDWVLALLQFPDCLHSRQLYSDQSLSRGGTGKAEMANNIFIMQVLNPKTGELSVTNVFHYTFMIKDKIPPTIIPKTYHEVTGNFIRKPYILFQHFSQWCISPDGDISSPARGFNIETSVNYFTFPLNVSCNLFVVK